MRREIKNLDQVLLTEHTVIAWKAKVLGVKFPSGTDPATVPDEVFRIEDDGSLTILCQVPWGEPVTMTVPPGEWKYVD